MDTYDYKERKSQQWFSRWRDAFFAPVIKLFRYFHITPDMVSFVGVIFLSVGCLLGPDYPIETAMCLVIYVVMDGLDGPLARSLGTASRGGSLVDICADQMGVVFIAAAAVYHLDVEPAFAVLFAASYVALIALVVAANVMQLRLFIFLRVKYPFYVVYVVSLMTVPVYLDWFMKLGSLYYLVNFYLLILAVRRQLDERDRMKDRNDRANEIKK